MFIDVLIRLWFLRFQDMYSRIPVVDYSTTGVTVPLHCTVYDSSPGK